VVVGHLDLIALHRIGDGDGSMMNRGFAVALQVSVDGVGELRMVGSAQSLDRVYLPGCAFQREAGIGAANISQQTRTIHEDVRRVITAMYKRC